MKDLIEIDGRRVDVSLIHPLSKCTRNKKKTASASGGHISGDSVARMNSRHIEPCGSSHRAISFAGWRRALSWPALLMLEQDASTGGPDFNDKQSVVIAHFEFDGA